MCVGWGGGGRIPWPGICFGALHDTENRDAVNELGLVSKQVTLVLFLYRFVCV